MAVVAASEFLKSNSRDESSRNHENLALVFFFSSVKVSVQNSAVRTSPMNLFDVSGDCQQVKRPFFLIE
jgi:hypothetical protein